MAICKGIVDAMNGTIHVTSEERKGTSIVLKLPLQLGRSQDLAVAKMPNLKVLLVEPHPIQVEILTKYINTYHCSLRVARSISEAITIMDACTPETQFDVSFVNCTLPDGSGEELLTEMNEHARGPIHRLLIAPLVHAIKPTAAKHGCLWKPVKLRHLYNHLVQSQQPSPVNLPKAIVPVAPTKPIVETAKILIVDDNLCNLKVAEMLLRALGLTCYKAGDGQEMLDITNTTKFQLIFLDMHMPRMNGIDAAILFRQREQNQQVVHPVPIVAMTAASSLQDRRRCLEAGMNFYLSKPVQKAELADCLQKYIPSFKEAAMKLSNTDHKIDVTTSFTKSSDSDSDELNWLEERQFSETLHKTKRKMFQGTISTPLSKSTTRLSRSITKAWETDQNTDTQEVNTSFTNANLRRSDTEVQPSDNYKTKQFTRTSLLPGNPSTETRIEEISRTTRTTRLVVSTNVGKVAQSSGSPHDTSHHFTSLLLFLLFISVSLNIYYFLAQ